MISVVGNKKQEEKIDRMGEIAHTLFPEIPKINFKGIFRYGIEESLKMNGVEQWSDIAIDKPALRIQFFNTILDSSLERLTRQGLNDNQIKALFDNLKKENFKYST